MWCFLPIAVVLLLSIIPTVTEVVMSMSDCSQFLLHGTPPQVPGILEGGKILNQNRYKPICQTYYNITRFVTLYDIKNKIPVFSAKKYRGEQAKKRPGNYWKIEPQLEDEHDNKNMMLGKRHMIYTHQAGDGDYRYNGVYDRGHLIPSSYAFGKVDKTSTFTLTNIVPQAATFNQGSWNRMERCIKCVMDKYCKNNNDAIEGFVVTGAQPTSNTTLNNRINIPSMMWSAFCCYSSTRSMWLASAHWGDNVPESENKYLQTKTLAELYDQLRTVDSEFNVFPGAKCPLHTTVTEFYPEMNNTCNCSSSFSTPSTSAPPTTPTDLSDPPTSTLGSLSATSDFSPVNT
ncbi:hypothetical protein Q8A73_012769 [Channa argus]|nr:hypothetical protein Q8A73_012769 [Channa argus]